MAFVTSTRSRERGPDQYVVGEGGGVQANMWSGRERGQTNMWSGRERGSDQYVVGERGFRLICGRGGRGVQTNKWSGRGGSDQSGRPQTGGGCKIQRFRPEFVFST